MKELTIQGMHCDACAKLITMELEEIGLKNQIEQLALSGENRGVLKLKEEVTEDQVTQIKETINAMEGYSIDA